MGNRRFASVLTGIAVAVGVLSAGNQIRVYVRSAPAALIHEAAQPPYRSQAICKQCGVDAVKLAESRVEVSASNAVPVDVRGGTLRVEWPAELTSSTRSVYRQQWMATQRALGAFKTTLRTHVRPDRLLMQDWGGLAQGVARQVEPWLQKNRSRLRPVAR